jgi:DNA-binding transcriptional LysR family regulator
MKNWISYVLRKPAPMAAKLRSQHVLNEPLMVALPNNHCLAQTDGVIQLSDLEPYEFVLYRRLGGQDLFDNIMASCYQAGFSPHVVQEAPRLTRFKLDCGRDWFINCACIDS